MYVCSESFFFPPYLHLGITATFTEVLNESLDLGRTKDEVEREILEAGPPVWWLPWTYSHCLGRQGRYLFGSHQGYLQKPVAPISKPSRRCVQEGPVPGDPMRGKVELTRILFILLPLICCLGTERRLSP